MRQVHRSFALLALAACTSTSSDSPSVNDTPGRTAPGDSVVIDLLLAQLDGPGGCATVDRLDTLRSTFFPEVELFSTDCSPEHGGTAEAIAGRDRQGTVFLLRSEVGFAFLLRRHPPAISPLNEPLDYASIALRLSGSLRPGGRIVREARELSSAELERVRRAGIKAFSRVLERRTNAVVVALLVISPRRLESLAVSVSPDGHLFTLHREELPSR